ncbi:MAG: bifunctional (p)ppGpp synthetase/guanosine-3',5'-bis(diphosphate) 3'-pyrophosphohydrolase [Bacteroidales bacterium]|nr:bifunctional (p)ppGpp synthetase/guanosine-3',5'-bis(diphosphate) 3'-pyrophosphohydrolase [Bacteroidales bacterium]
MKESMIIKAAVFAAEKHRYQRRKGFNQIPYINHPLKVANLLIECGENESNLLISSILHDVIEDTDATEAEVTEKFNSEIAKLVLEVSDNKELPYTTRKELQVKKAPGLSHDAKLIKVADKICNIRDFLVYPVDWSPERKLAYLDWAKLVVAGCRGLNEKLDQVFDETLEKGTNQLNAEL